MPTLTVAGHSVTVGDEFLKLSPEDQDKTVDEIAKSLPAEKPSGVGAGFAHGVSGLASGVSSTLGLAGVKSDALDAAASKTEPTNYKAAPIIREGGHWYNPADYDLSAVPQNIAEQAPGMASDIAAGKVGATIGSKIGGTRGAVIGGGIGGLGSMLLRTFGPGAHENAAARTGDANAPVTGGDMAREAAKQAVVAPLNVLGVNRLIPGLASKVEGVGADAAGSALKKYLATVGTEAGAGGVRDAVNQVGSTIGTDKGVQYDPNKTAEAAITSGATGGAMAAPRAAADVSAATKFRQFGGDNAEAATALANRQLEHADGKALVGPLGGTKVADTARDNAHADVQRELSDAAKTEELSTDNANTLKRIQNGGTASNKELNALADEASPETVHLARQALLSSKLKSMGGGISGAMESLTPIKHPVASTLAAIAGHAGGLGVLGAIAPPILGGVFGTYAAARAFDKMSGARSPVEGFTSKFGDPEAPTRMPAPPVEELPPEEPSLRNTLNANAKIEDGMAKIAKKIGDQKRKDTISNAMPLIKQLAAQSKPAPVAPPVEPEKPNLSPVAMMMLKQKLKQGLPPEPAPAPPPAPEAPQISPTALSMLKQKLKQGLPPEPAPAPVAPPAPPPEPEPPQISPMALKMLKQKMKEGPPAPPPAPPEPAPQMPQFNPVAMAMLKSKMKQGLPDATPASPQIAQAMQTVAQHSAPPAAPQAPAPAAPAPAAPAAPPVTSMADILSRINAPQTPKAPIIAKISKKLNGTVHEVPHPESEQPYEPTEDQWRKGLSDQDVAAKALAQYEPAQRAKYSKTIIGNRAAHRSDLEAIAHAHGADGAAIEGLFHDLDHVSSRAKARKSIAHFTNFMSPQAAKAVHERYTDKLISQRWKD